MFKKALAILAVLLVIIFITPWFQKILAADKIIAIILFIETYGLSLYLTNPDFKKVAIFTFSGLLILSTFLVITQFDKNLVNHSNLDLAYLQQRRSYYPYKLGSFFHNQYTLSIFYYQRNFFTNLDFNQFFFGGQPRLRPYALDFEKFPILYLPFFLYGIILLFSKRKLFVRFVTFTTFILIFAAFANPSFQLGPYIIFPIITSLVFMGLYQFIIFL